MTMNYVPEPTTPSKIQKHVDHGGSSVSVASTISPNQDKSLPNGWTCIQHPDASVYFVHEEKHLYTSSNVFDERIRNQITEKADRLRSSPAFQNDAFQGLLKEHAINAVLDVQSDGVSYYCVSHVIRRIFWVEDVGQQAVDVPCMLDNCTKSGVHCNEAQYWKHCELFPTTFTLTKEVIRDLNNTLCQAAAGTDRLSVTSSPSLYIKVDLEYMYILNMLKEIEADRRESSDHSAWIAAKFMVRYSHEVLQGSCGQYDVGNGYPPNKNIDSPTGDYESLLMYIFSPLLRGVHQMYRQRLLSLRKDCTQKCWLDFLNGVGKNIRDSNLLATVLLTTNVGLLTWIAGNNPGQDNSLKPEQILAYISIICSYGSVGISFTFFNPYRTISVGDPSRALSRMTRLLQEPYGLAKSAIFFSLPEVFLAWALDTFLVAFCIVFYKGTGIAVRISVTVALAFVVLAYMFPEYALKPSTKLSKCGSPPMP